MLLWMQQRVDPSFVIPTKIIQRYESLVPGLTSHPCHPIKCIISAICATRKTQF
ncbi:hypothetical protein Hanom_Chr16g01521811 [Helianthus anomalus]